MIRVRRGARFVGSAGRGARWDCLGPLSERVGNHGGKGTLSRGLCEDALFCTVMPMPMPPRCRCILRYVPRPRCGSDKALFCLRFLRRLSGTSLYIMVKCSTGMFNKKKGQKGCKEVCFSRRVGNVAVQRVANRRSVQLSRPGSKLQVPAAGPSARLKRSAGRGGASPRRAARMALPRSPGFPIVNGQRRRM